MFLPSYIQHLVDSHLISFDKALTLNYKTIKALNYKIVQDAITRGSVTPDHIETITCIHPNYVGRMLRTPRFLYLIVQNYLTTPLVNKLTKDALYDWLFSPWLMVEFYARGIITPEFLTLMAYDDLRSVTQIERMPMLILQGHFTLEHFKQIKCLETINFLKIERVKKTITSGHFHPDFLTYTKSTFSRCELKDPITLRLIASGVLTPMLFSELLKKPAISLLTRNPNVEKLLIARIIPLAQLIEADYAEILILKNYWVQTLLKHGSIRYQNVLNLRFAYAAAYAAEDSRKHYQLITLQLKQRMQALILEKEQDLGSILPNAISLFAIIRALPELRQLIVLAVLGSQQLFTKLIQTQQDYVKFRLLCHDPAEHLPGYCRHILKHDTLENAQKGMIAFIGEIKIRLAAKVLLQGWRDTDCHLYRLPIDLIIAIVAHSANAESLRNVDETKHLANQTVLGISQLYRPNKRRYCEQLNHPETWIPAVTSTIYSANAGPAIAPAPSR